MKRVKPTPVNEENEEGHSLGPAYGEYVGGHRVGNICNTKSATVSLFDGAAWRFDSGGNANAGGGVEPVVDRAVTQGTGEYQRVGRRVAWQSLHYRFVLTPPAGATQDFLTFLIVYDALDSLGSWNSGIMDRMFSTTVAGVRWLALMNPDTTDEYRVLKRKMFCVMGNRDTSCKHPAYNGAAADANTYLLANQSAYAVNQWGDTSAMHGIILEDYINLRGLPAEFASSSTTGAAIWGSIRFILLGQNVQGTSTNWSCTGQYRVRWLDV